MKIEDIYKPGYSNEIINIVKRDVHPDRRSPKNNILAILHRFADNAERCLDGPWDETAREDAKLWIAGMIYAVELLEEARIPQGDRIC